MSRIDNSNRYINLRNEYPEFIYQGFDYTISGNKISVVFDFRQSESIVFHPTANIYLPKIPHFRENIHSLIENIIFNIGMIELISYWKAACSPKIIVKAGILTDRQVAWWKKVYFNGLGEFFYLNGLDVTLDNFVSISSEGPKYIKDSSVDFTGSYLVPIGGGKDSAVTLELLKNAGYEVHPVIMNPRGATLETVTASGISVDKIIKIERTIDPLLLKLNDQGFLNGHTPFSAMLAFYTLLVSVLTGHTNIALSNESSANEATIPGTSINHQYSKSYDFEKDFREYYSEYVHEGFNYFSFLRPLNEIQIMKIFASLTRYHKVFKSCNVGSKTNDWCGKCPKCLFTHIMLSAYMGVDYSNEIIGSKMLDDTGHTGYFDELSGISEIKPFECVGTIDDVQTAMRMIIKNTPDDKIPILAQRFRQFDIIKRGMMAGTDIDFSSGIEDLKTTIMSDDVECLNEVHFLNDELVHLLKRALK